MSEPFRVATDAEVARSSYSGARRCAGITTTGAQCQRWSPWHWDEVQFGTYYCFYHMEPEGTPL